MIDGWGISCEIALIWMSVDFTDDQSILVQVMAWCRQATSHYLSQCWSRSLLPYGVTGPQVAKWDRVTHICVSKRPLVQIMACCPFGGKLLSEPMLYYCQLDPLENFQLHFNQNAMISIHENAFENSIYKMATILSLPQFVIGQARCCRKCVLKCHVLPCLFTPHSDLINFNSVPIRCRARLIFDNYGAVNYTQWYQNTNK